MLVAAAVEALLAPPDLAVEQGRQVGRAGEGGLGHVQIGEVGNPEVLLPARPRLVIIRRGRQMGRQGLSPQVRDHIEQGADIFLVEMAGRLGGGGVEESGAAGPAGQGEGAVVVELLEEGVHLGRQEQSHLIRVVQQDLQKTTGYLWRTTCKC